jgi:hypothetical protein
MKKKSASARNSARKSKVFPVSTERDRRSPDPREAVPTRSGAKARREKERSARSADIEMDHLDLAAGFLRDQRGMASLRQMTDPKTNTRSLHELTLRELSALVVHRLEQTEGNRPFIHMLGVRGPVDNARAVEEVRTLSHVGCALIDIETRFIRFLLERESGRL